MVSVVRWSGGECCAVVLWRVLCGGPMVSVVQWSSGECFAVVQW